MIFYYLIPLATMQRSSPKAMFINGYTAALMDLAVVVIALVWWGW